MLVHHTAAQASPRPSCLRPCAYSPRHHGGSGQLSLPGASPLGWGHALKQLTLGKEGGLQEGNPGAMVRGHRATLLRAACENAGHSEQPLEAAWGGRGVEWGVSSTSTGLL